MIGKTVKMIREIKDISQKEFADQLGISVSYVSQIEQGKKDPSMKVARGISRVLNVPVALLFISDGNNDALTTREVALLLQIRDIILELEQLHPRQDSHANSKGVQ